MGERKAARGDSPCRRTTTLLAVGQLVVWGALYYAFAVLLPVMRVELGWSPALLSGAFSVGLVTAGLCAPAVGGLVDRAGSRPVMTVGSLVGAAGLVLWAAAARPATLLAAWLLIGVAMATTLYEPAFATVIREYPSQGRRSVLAISLVGALASPLFTPLTAWTTERLGWRLTLLLFAAAVAGTAALHARLPAVARRPRSVDAASSREPMAAKARRRVGSRALTLGVAASAGVATAANAHVIAVLLEFGHTLERVAVLVGGIGLAKIPGRAAVAAVPDRFDARRVVAATLIVQAGGLAAVMGPAGLVVALPLLFGGASGAMTVLKPIAVAALGDTANFARRSGRIHRTTTLVTATTPFLLGAGATWAAGYRPLWWTLPSVLLVVAALLMREPRTPMGPPTGRQRRRTRTGTFSPSSLCRRVDAGFASSGSARTAPALVAVRQSGRLPVGCEATAGDGRWPAQ